MRIGRIAGFELRIHWSTLIIFGLLVWTLAAVQLPDQAPDASGGALLVAALFTGVAFYGALLAHEVSHAILARRHGIEVESLTLWLLGGVASLKGEPRTPAADLQIAAVGPLVSFTLGVGFGVVGGVLAAVDAPRLLVATLGWLAGINVVLALFNLIPAAPLDGGRVLRAALWQWRGDRSEAAVAAARAGEVTGYVFVGLGLLSLFLPGIGGLWFVILGWFLVNAARAEREHTETVDALGDLTVAGVMTRNPVVAPAEATVAEILDHFVMATRHSAFPLRDRAGRCRGLVTLSHLRSVPPGQRRETRAADVACPMTEVATASPDERLADLLPRLNTCAEGRALVIEDGWLRGIVTPTDVSRAVEVAQFRGRPPTAGPTPASRPEPLAPTEPLSGTRS